jgi:nucleotide-binding universal stress UspA family protein
MGHGSEAGAFKDILCAVGLAPSSIGVIKQALSLAWETHGHVTFVCVMTGPRPSPSDIRTEFLAAIPPEAHSWCDIQLVVTPGVPATEIVRIAETSNVELLLIGPPRQWTSTTHAVLAKSLCPVLIAQDARPLPYPPGKVVTAGGAPH